MKHISSLKNIELKKLNYFKQRKGTKKNCLFVIEGEREFQKALQANYVIQKFISRRAVLNV